MNESRINDLDERVTAGLVVCNDHGGFASADCPRCTALNALSLILAALSDAEQRAAQAKEERDEIHRESGRLVGELVAAEARAAKLEAAAGEAVRACEAIQAGYLVESLAAVLADLAADEEKA